MNQCSLFIIRGFGPHRGGGPCCLPLPFYTWMEVPAHLACSPGHLKKPSVHDRYQILIYKRIFWVMGPFRDVWCPDYFQSAMSDWIFFVMDFHLPCSFPPANGYLTHKPKCAHELISCLRPVNSSSVHSINFSTYFTVKRQFFPSVAGQTKTTFKLMWHEVEWFGQSWYYWEVEKSCYVKQSWRHLLGLVSKCWLKVSGEASQVKSLISFSLCRWQ